MSISVKDQNGNPMDLRDLAVTFGAGKQPLQPNTVHREGIIFA